MKSWSQFNKGFIIEPNVLRSRQIILSLGNGKAKPLLAQLQHGIFREVFKVSDQYSKELIACIRTGIGASHVFLEGDEDNSIGSFVVNLAGLSSSHRDLVSFNDTAGRCFGSIVAEPTHGKESFLDMPKGPPTRLRFISNAHLAEEAGCQGHFTMDYWLLGVSKLSFSPEPSTEQGLAVAPIVLICGCVVLLRRLLSFPG